MGCDPAGRDWQLIGPSGNPQQIGPSHSSPVVWGDRVFVTTAISSSNNSLRVGLYGDINPVRDNSEHTWKVYALDA